MKLLDMMYEQAFEERMAAAEGHGALVHMSREALDRSDYDTAFLAWLIAGSHDWPDNIKVTYEWTAEDYDALNY